MSDITQKVRQRGSYKVIGVIQLKGRRRYNFSLKFRPAMTYGHVSRERGDLHFVDGYYELSQHSDLPTMNGNTPNEHNTGWYWGQSSPAAPGVGAQSARESYFFPGGDALVTNLIESSSISVEFFYGQSLSSVQEQVSALVDGFDPALGV